MSRVPRPSAAGLAKHFANAWPDPLFAKLTQLRRRYDPDGILALVPEH
jgi:hypothetical protein